MSRICSRKEVASASPADADFSCSVVVLQESTLSLHLSISSLLESSVVLGLLEDH